MEDVRSRKRNDPASAPPSDQHSSPVAWPEVAHLRSMWQKKPQTNLQQRLSEKRITH